MAGKSPLEIDETEGPRFIYILQVAQNEGRQINVETDETVSSPQVL